MNKDERVTDAIDALAQEIRRLRGPGMGAGELAEALMPFVAALSSPEEEKAVKVKALEWQFEVDNGIRRWTATDPFGHPFEHLTDCQGWWSSWRSPAFTGRFENQFETAEEGKAAAQADYETRILSALVDVPAVESEPVAWYIERNGERLITDNDIIRDRWLNVGREPIPLYTHPPRTTPVPALVGEDEVERLTRPIIGIGARSPQEVFHIMSDRIRFALTRRASTEEVGGSTSVAKGCAE